MRRITGLLVVLLMLVQVSALAQVAPVPQVMNFQGRITRPDGTPVADGNYSLRLSLWSALAGGTEVWNQSLNPVTVRNGTFAILLSGFPAGTFNGNLYLEIKIGTDVPLTPRQQLVSVAYAMKANSVSDGSITAASIASGTITVDKLASGTLNPLAWLLGGNADTAPANHFLGTTDNQPLVFKANHQRILKLEYAQDAYYEGNNFIGGYWLNSVTDGVVGATVFGGIKAAGEDYPNRVTDNGGTVLSGLYNVAGNDNADLWDAFGAIVCGGYYNLATSWNATILGGYWNTASGGASIVGGGESNTASGDFAIVNGGVGNLASSNTAFVGGGGNNTASNWSTVVGGGISNTASGVYATVPGGSNNTASGSTSFAAGHRAQAIHNGTFVWGDSMDTDFISSNVNQFLIRAAGGVGINTNDPAGFALNVAGNIQCVSLTQTSDLRYKFHIQSLPDALASILNLRGVTFDWKRADYPGMNFADGKQIGFIAQEVEKVLPELVTTDSNGYKSVAYSNVVPVLVEAVKTQNRKMETLTKENAELRGEMEALKTLVRQLSEQQAKSTSH